MSSRIPAPDPADYLVFTVPPQGVHNPFVDLAVVFQEDANVWIWTGCLHHMKEVREQMTEVFEEREWGVQGWRMFRAPRGRNMCSVCFGLEKGMSHPHSIKRIPIEEK